MASESAKQTAVKQPEMSIHNETPWRLLLHGKDAQLTLAPLERTALLPDEELRQFDVLQQLQRDKILSLESAPIRDPSAVFVLTFMATLMYFIWGSIWLEALKGKYLTRSVQFWADYFLPIGVVMAVLLLAGGLLWKYRRSTDELLRGVAEVASLLMSMAVGIVLPAVVIYYFGGVSLPLKAEKTETGPSLLALGRGLQLLFIASASLLPALLYFLFDRQWLQTLRDRFYQAIFRLDPKLETLSEVRAKYPQIQEAYGLQSGGRARQLAGTRIPILFATMLIALGWLLALSPFDPDAKIKTAADLQKLFVPQSTFLVFGFLGAYFFGLTDLLRRYMRRDLKPKAYSSIAVRILVVSVLSWVMALLPDKRFIVAFMFLIGFVPETGLTLLRESFRKVYGHLLNKLDNDPLRLVEQTPLTALDDIDLYDRSRLLDEGVTNVESLAHHDLIDLMIETRIPVPRLVDWVDQAILYLHLPHGTSGKDDQLRARLSKFGIRTATDLETVCGRAGAEATKEQEDFMKAIAGGDGLETGQLRVILAAFADDEWLSHIRAWRNPKDAEKREYPQKLAAVA